LKTETRRTASLTALHLGIECNVQNLLPGTTGVRNVLLQLSDMLEFEGTETGRTVL